ncbi:MAG: glycosyltransferase [Nitrospirota bacterium]|nr:glycosyltransferase [Nitrospirota bacterium]
MATLREKTDILIFSASYGGGHRRVSHAVETAIFSLDKGIKTRIIDLFEVISPLINKFNLYSYVTTMRKAPYLYGWAYELSYDLPLNNFLNRMISKIGLEKLKGLLRDISPRGILSTYPSYGMLSELKRKGLANIISAVVITDFVAHSQWIHPHVDQYFVPSAEVKYHLIKKGILPETVQITGIPISMEFLQPVDRDEVFRKYDVIDDVPVILVMAGIFGMTRGVTEICVAIEELAIDVQAVVLCGNDKKLFSKLTDTFSDKGIIKPIFGQVDVHKLMVIASLLISKSGGITVSEALAKELPVLIYKPLPGQEYHNAVFLSKTEAGIIIKNKKELKNILRFLLADKKYLNKMKEASRIIKKPEAAMDVANSLIEMVNFSL